MITHPIYNLHDSEKWYWTWLSLIQYHFFSSPKLYIRLANIQYFFYYWLLFVTPSVPYSNRPVGGSYCPGCACGVGPITCTFINCWPEMKTRQIDTHGADTTYTHHGPTHTDLHIQLTTLYYQETIPCHIVHVSTLLLLYLAILYM